MMNNPVSKISLEEELETRVATNERRFFATNIQDDVSVRTAHHGRMILRTAVVNFISQIDFFLSNQQQKLFPLNTKLCRVVTTALRSLHATLSYQAEHEEFREHLVEYEFTTLIELLMFKVFDQQVDSVETSGGCCSSSLAKKWLICKKWALRLSSLLVELLLLDADGHMSQENKLAARKLMAKLISVLKNDLTMRKSRDLTSICDDAWEQEEQSSRAIVTLATRLLHRLLSIEDCKLPSEELNRLITELASPLACKYVTNDKLYHSFARDYLREFTLSYELERELQLGSCSSTQAVRLPARKSIHSATICLLLRLIELANDENHAKILASLGQFYQILDRAVSRAAAAVAPTTCETNSVPNQVSAPTAEEGPRGLLVALLVINRLEFDSEPSSLKCRQLFTKLVLLPILGASSGYLRARLYWLMQEFYWKTASLLPEVLASLAVQAHDDLSLNHRADLVLQASAARLLQALLASGDLKNLVARYEHLKQADILNRVEMALCRARRETLPVLYDHGDDHDEWHWITKSQSELEQINI